MTGFIKMSTKVDYSQLTREQLIELVTGKHQATGVKTKSTTGSGAYDVFVGLKDLLGTFELKALPGFKVTVKRLNQFDKRSMTLLFDVVDADGNHLPKVIFGYSGDAGTKDALNVSLKTLTDFIKLPKAKAIVASEIDTLCEMLKMEGAAKGIKKGYAESADFAKLLSGVRNTLALMGDETLVARLK